MSSEVNCDMMIKFRFDPANYSLLILDSSSSITHALSLILKKFGYGCFCANSFDAAEGILQNNTIEYVLLDLELENNESEQLFTLLETKKIKIFGLQKNRVYKEYNLPYHVKIVDILIKDKNLFHKIDTIHTSISYLEKNRYKKIALLSNCETDLQNLSIILSNRNYSVLSSTSKQNFFEQLLNHSVDLVLLDLDTNDFDIFDFLQSFEHELSILKKTPVVVMGSNIDNATKKMLLKEQVAEVFQKPYLEEELIGKVDVIIDYKRKEDEVLCSTALLSEYKNAVDESSIVSKSSPSGIITYVNDKFCELSGYSKEELLGKNHNIVRHKDMSKEVFRDLWYTIKVLKSSWRGKVKNRKKDGSAYWVDALIKPIIDKNGQIVEFIGLRNDITEIENYKEILKDKLTNTSLSLKDNMIYTQQYEEALSKFTAVIKTDTKNIITYINEEFSTISGYDLSELIGTNCTLLRHDTDVFSQTSSNIEEILAQNKHISLTTTNIAKDGTLYFVDTIIYPITNSKGEVYEHLYLMHDVTELTNLHKEIEETQKEIVYKIGEIGESRSKETGNHVKRVAEYSKKLALLAGLSTKEAEVLFTASPMHDIGKVAISDSILKKPARLTDEEYNIMKTHTTIGYDILKGSSREVLEAAAIVANEHHEKYNGTGYPQGLKGDEIHIYGKITAIADVFDALGSDRCYKDAWCDEKILNFFIKEKGEHFDPVLTEIFLDNWYIFLDIRNKYKDY